MAVDAKTRTFLAIFSITVLCLHLFNHTILKGKTTRKIVSIVVFKRVFMGSHHLPKLKITHPSASLVSANVRLSKNLAFTTFKLGSVLHIVIVCVDTLRDNNDPENPLHKSQK